ncbi:MAG: FtsQ-type POTRA domain-containing protein [Clostridiales bacterium]|nr:FtsQ-type POTRA domain-containing protein [Clostridiales bacterium]
MKEVKKTRNTPSREAARAANGMRHRKRRKRSYTLYYLLLLFFVLISGVTLSLTVFFNIETITVNGSSLNSAEQIISQSGIKKGDNLFRINPEKAEKMLTNNMDNIDTVRVERKFPSSLVIHVTDAVPTYYVADGGSYTVISEGKRILDTGVAKEQVKASIRLEGLEVSGFQKGDFIAEKDDNKLELLQKIKQAAVQNELTDITAINLTNDVELSIEIENRLTVRLGNSTELSYKINFAKNIIDTKLEQDEIGVVDASKPGKIYFSPGSASSNASTTIDEQSSALSGETSSGTTISSQSAVSAGIGSE